MGILTLKGIRLVANVVVAFVIVSGAALATQKIHQLATAPDEINIVKLDVPWHHPAENVAILLDRNALAENPDLHQSLQISIFSYDLVKRIVYASLLVVILVLVKKLILSIQSRTLFEPKSLATISHLALTVAGYVACKFLFYQIIPFFVPVDLMVETVNFTTLGESVFGNVMAAVDFKMLFVGFCLYVISVAFKEGYQLKSEAELTI
jgi:hypothetical protein